MRTKQAGGEACAKTFIQSFASHAFRRPLGDEEIQKLVDLFHVGADGATYAEGIELVATGVLQSAGFLYLTEIGNDPSASQVKLTPYETASSLSYLVTAGPPDAELMTAASNGQLDTAEQRSAVFTRLMSGANPAASRARVLRVVQEWLGIDRLSDTAKDTQVYGAFAGLKPAMVSESGAFLQRLIERKTGTVGELLGANWTATQDQGLTKLYGGSAAADGEISLPERRGILNQAAFLSVYAHASETAPVLRGLAVLRRVACKVVQSPSEINAHGAPAATRSDQDHPRTLGRPHQRPEVRQLSQRPSTRSVFPSSSTTAWASCKSQTATANPRTTANRSIAARPSR